MGINLYITVLVTELDFLPEVTNDLYNREMLDIIFGFVVLYARIHKEIAGYAT